MIRFLTALGAVTILIYLSLWWMSQRGLITPPSWQHESIGFLVFITIATYAYLYKLSEGEPRRFTLFYLGSIVVKILAGCAFVAIMIVADRERAFSNAGLFLSTYLVFTLVEVLMLFRKLEGRQKGY